MTAKTPPLAHCAGTKAPFRYVDRGCANLVVVRAGRSSLHRDWLGGDGDQNFDLLITAYEDDVTYIQNSHTAVVSLPGPKISGYYKLFQRYPELLDYYDYIALFDDDIKTSKQDIGRLFEIGRRFHLDLFQPALSWDSYFSYAATLAIPDRFILRYTNCVEMMCPVFSSRHLKRALPLFGLGYETGIDLLWTRLSDAPYFRHAIVDDVVVSHTRPVGTTKTQQGFKKDESYDVQIENVLKRYGAVFRGFVTYSAIDRSGHPILSRYFIGFCSMALWAAWRRTPMCTTDFVRFVTDYTRHCFFRPINLHKIRLDLGRAAFDGEVPMTTQRGE